MIESTLTRPRILNRIATLEARYTDQVALLDAARQMAEPGARSAATIERLAFQASGTRAAIERLQHHARVVR